MGFSHVHVYEKGRQKPQKNGSFPLVLDGFIVNQFHSAEYKKDG